MQREWSVARYGTLEAFGPHLGRTALAMGLEQAKQLVFLSDGLAANWQICMDHFPDALRILDFYHASEWQRQGGGQLQVRGGQTVQGKWDALEEDGQ